jgi:hypothetical protein
VPSLQQQCQVISPRVCVYCTLLTGEDGKLELLDFKSQKRPNNNASELKKYCNQLYMHVHILNERYAKYPERMYIYWTAERDRDYALMQIPIDEYEIQKAKNTLIM